MIDDAIITQVHKLANERLYQKYPLFDMADLIKHSEGHFKIEEIEIILEVFIDIQRATQSDNHKPKLRRGKSF